MKCDHLHLRRSHRLLLLGVAALALPAAAQAAAPGGGQVYALSDAQKAQVLEAGRAAVIDGTLPSPPGSAADRQVHGEFSAMVGTGAARGVAGTAAIPLGQNGGAVISFENSRFGNRRYR